MAENRWSRRTRDRWAVGMLWAAAVVYAGAGLPSATARAQEKPSALKTAAAEADRILIAIPDHRPAKDGQVDVPPGGRFAIEVESELRGTGNKSVLIINGGQADQYPRYVNGKQYVFLLKRNPNGKGWVNLGNREIPIKDGKVQWLVDGKVAEEVPLPEFEEFAAATIEAVDNKIPRRETLTGNWVLIRNDSGTEMYLWMLKFQEATDNQPPVKLVASNKLIESTTLKSARVTGDEIELEIVADNNTFTFEGRFADGIVRGTMSGGYNQALFPIRMEPTDEKSMKKKYDEPRPDPLYEEFVQSVSQENAVGPLSRFVRRHPLSALTFTAYQVLVSHSATERQPRERFEKLGTDFRGLAAKWGPRMELQALVDLGASLSVRDHLPELALEYLNEAQQRFTDLTPADLKKTVEIERGRRLIAAGQNEAGLQVLNAVRSAHPFDPMVLYALARQAEKDQRQAEALELYGELQVLPKLEQMLVDSMKTAGQKLSVDQYPRRIVARLWIEQHGSGDGLPEWLEQLYARRIRALVPEPRPARSADGGNRVALCELFTSTTSLPSIAAEAAVSNLQAWCGESDVVVLRYHIHEPSPDPLANIDCQERFKMYLGQAAPVLVLNGRRQIEPGGALSQATNILQRMQTELDTCLQDRTDMRIALSAQTQQGKIAISAKALGLSEFPANVRMVVALAEDKIELPAKNGIRIHEMVVRALLAGPGGIPAMKGTLEFTADIEVDKLRKNLERLLREKASESETTFEVVPLALSALHLVAFLQNSETAEIYQAATIPVSGLTARGPAGKPVTGKTADEPASPGNKK